MWRLVSERPEHLIDPRYKTWDELLLAAADEVVAEATDKTASKLADYTWGSHNTTKIQHPLSLAVPQLGALARHAGAAAAGRFREHAAHPGARRWAPRSGWPSRRVTKRDGYLHMPCGQSGHPLSPHYGDAHSAWADGKATAHSCRARRSTRSC